MMELPAAAACKVPLATVAARCVGSCASARRPQCPEVIRIPENMLSTFSPPSSSFQWPLHPAVRTYKSNERDAFHLHVEL